MEQLETDIQTENYNQEMKLKIAYRSGFVCNGKSFTNQ